MITSLRPNEIFVFGSNLGGQHAGGAAALAHEKFEAEWGIGEGLSGHTYAFPTLTESFLKLDRTSLESSRNKLYATCRALPRKKFLLTKVGCGIAGYSEVEMASLFTDCPKNLVKPEGW